MTFTRHDALPFALALAIPCVSYLAYASSVPRRTTTPTAPPLHSLMSARVAACRLPAGKQVASVKAFAEMMPVFTHDRCANCHGQFNVLSTDEHTGAGAARESKLDPTALLTVPERIAFHRRCGDCHNQIQGKGVRRQLKDSTVISGWMLPPAPMRWVGKDTEQLCLLVKGFEENADSFISHVASDHGEVQFVKAAFEGKRALDSTNMDLYDVVPEPPPGSMGALIAQATRWARLVGDHWTDSRECGCVMPKLKLKIQHTWVFDTPGGVPSREASDAQFEVMLEKYGDDRPNYFQGQFSLERPIAMTVPAFCTGARIRERALAVQRAAGYGVGLVEGVAHADQRRADRRDRVPAGRRDGEDECRSRSAGGSARRGRDGDPRRFNRPQTGGVRGDARIARDHRARGA